MRIKDNVLGTLFGASLLLLGGSSQAAVITAAADFDLASLSISSTGGIASVTPLFYTASAESPRDLVIDNDVAPVTSIVNDSYSTGFASVVSDAAAITPDFVSVVAIAFDGGFATGSAGIEIAYEALGDGDVTVSVDYSAFYGLDGSPTADALVSLAVDDSLSGALDAFDLIAGDPDFAIGTLSIGFFAAAGDVGSIFLSAFAGADTGISSVPVPGVLLLIGTGWIGLSGLRFRTA